MELPGLSGGKHDYEECDDEHCQRYGCVAYKKGHAAGYLEGEGAGYGNGYAAGYGEGQSDGYKQGFSDGESSSAGS